MCWKINSNLRLTDLKFHYFASWSQIVKTPICKQNIYLKYFLVLSHWRLLYVVWADIYELYIWHIKKNTVILEAILTWDINLVFK